MLKAYVGDIIATYRCDPRILFWDLYNEPGNRMNFSKTACSYFDAAIETHALSLMEGCFSVARAASPNAPLSVAVWTKPLSEGDVLP